MFRLSGFIFRLKKTGVFAGFAFSFQFDQTADLGNTDS